MEDWKYQMLLEVEDEERALCIERFPQENTSFGRILACLQSCICVHIYNLMFHLYIVLLNSGSNRRMPNTQVPITNNLRAGVGGATKLAGQCSLWSCQRWILACKTCLQVVSSLIGHLVHCDLIICPSLTPVIHDQTEPSFLMIIVSDQLTVLHGWSLYPLDHLVLCTLARSYNLTCCSFQDH